MADGVIGGGILQFFQNIFSFANTGDYYLILLWFPFFVAKPASLYEKVF
ncbi:hypothetical protein [Aminobacter sp. HY435]|nr:hypothetical protein [Aminobacter sp. HY435]